MEQTEPLRPTLKYEPKLLIHISLQDGTTTDIFIRGNARKADVLAKLGLDATYRLYHEGKPLEDKSLKELGLEHHARLEVKEKEEP